MTSVHGSHFPSSAKRTESTTEPLWLIPSTLSLCPPTSVTLTRHYRLLRVCRNTIFTCKASTVYAGQINCAQPNGCWCRAIGLQHPAESKKPPSIKNISKAIINVLYCWGVSLRFTSALTCCVRLASPFALCCTSVLVERWAAAGAPVMKNGLRSSLGVCSGLASGFELIAPNHATQLLNYESPNEHI